MTTPDHYTARKIMAECALALLGHVWRDDADVETLIARMRHNAELAAKAVEDERKWEDVT